MTQRILVLGANGFIGRKLVAALHAADWAAPIAGVRAAPATPQEGVEHRIVDATDEAAVSGALLGADAVVNCVAGKTAAISQSARTLFTAASRLPEAPLVVHLSTMSVYGNAAGSIEESAALSAELGPYAEAKIEAEGAAAGYPRCVILRPGCVYGPDSPQWSVRIADFLMARRLGDLGANGDGFCNLVHVDDVVGAILQSLRVERGSAIFNLSTPDPPTWNDYLIRFGRALRAVPIKRISQRRLKIETKLLAPPLKILELGLKAAKLGKIHLPPPLPSSLASLMRQEIKLDVRRAEQVLGMHWKALDSGLEETAHWYLARNNSC
jgi:nucleoside-diphosphate-sugar epimerase